MNEVVKFENKEISVVREKGGFIIPSQKRFGEIYGLKGQALKRKHFDFKLEVGKLWNGELAAMKSRDEILAQKIVPTKLGMRVDYVATVNLTLPNAQNVGKAQAETRLKMATKLFEAGKFASLEEAVKFLY